MPGLIRSSGTLLQRKTIGRFQRTVQSFFYLPVIFATGERWTRMAPVGQNS